MKQTFVVEIEYPDYTLEEAIKFVSEEENKEFNKILLEQKFTKAFKEGIETWLISKDEATVNFVTCEMSD